MNHLKTCCAVLMAVLLWGAASAPTEAQVTAVSTRDNTLYESATGAFSNGKGIHLFTGRTAQGMLRRTVLSFDVRGLLPPGAVLDSVRLRLHMSRTTGAAGAPVLTLHRLTRSWGEGASDAVAQEGQGGTAQANDATWIHAFFNATRWDTPGGDYDPAPSAERPVGDEGFYTWGAATRMTEDVRGWIARSADNHGWLLQGGEGSGQSAKRFDSREHAQADNRPTLTLYFSTGVARESEGELPAAARITTLFPQPAAGRLQVNYALAEGDDVTFELYDVLGRRVATLREGWRGPGDHAARIEAPAMPPGVYLLQLCAGETRQVRQVVWTR